MPDIEIDYQPHEGQQLVHQSSARFRILACGARWGKDRCTINDLIMRCIMMAGEPGRQKLVPRVLAWYVAPTFTLTRQMWDEFRAFLPGDVAEFRTADRVINIPGGITIELKSADNPDSLVARGVDYLAITEAAKIPERAWYQSLRPRLSSPGRGPNGTGGLATINSTPSGKNWFYREWVKGQDRAKNPNYESWQFPTVSNPYIDPAEIEAARLDLPERWYLQEYCAEFVDDAGGVFRGVRENLQACPSFPFEPKPDRIYAAGIDWGRHDDSTVTTVLDVTESPFMIVDWDRFNKIDYRLQLQRVMKILDKWRPYKVVPEGNSIGDPLISQLELDCPYRIEPFITTASSKSLLINSLALAIERKEIVFPARELADSSLEPWTPVLINELESYEYKKTAAGNVTYNAPAGLHDDCVISLALANQVHIASGIARPVKMQTEWSGMWR